MGTQIPRGMRPHTAMAASTYGRAEVVTVKGTTITADGTMGTGTGKVATAGNAVDMVAEVTAVAAMGVSHALAGAR
jgi:hypothetical protein